MSGCDVWPCWPQSNLPVSNLYLARPLHRPTFSYESPRAIISKFLAVYGGRLDPTSNRPSRCEATLGAAARAPNRWPHDTRPFCWRPTLLRALSSAMLPSWAIYGADGTSDAIIYPVAPIPSLPAERAARRYEAISAIKSTPSCSSRPCSVESVVSTTRGLHPLAG